DAIIICGGLGPTHDDITREAIAELMGVELEFDDEVGAVIAEMFASRNRRMPEINMRQAMVPRGATVIPQRRGTAPGLICPVGDKVMYAVPGVPMELYEMYERAIAPDLLKRSGTLAAIGSRVLRTWGNSESGLNEQLFDVIAELELLGNPTLAFLASGWDGIKVRLTAKAPTQADVMTLLAVWEARVREAIGDLVFGVDSETMESVVIDLLRSRGLTLGLAESVTGGLVSGRLTNVPGASDVFRGGIVSYSSDVKFELLGVQPGSVVSEAAAVAMASGVRKVLDSDVGLALTGVAGPNEQDGQPVGTLCVGLALSDGQTQARTLHLPGGRDQMRQLSVISALDVLRRALRR
ncbi:MAG: CinA family nicotinamide mononucleotide deamidase-related protein, partial [Actinomycetota bacterium]